MIFISFQPIHKPKERSLYKKKLPASLTIEASYIFPIICIIFASIISLCFYLHDSINISSQSYLTLLDYSYKKYYDTDFKDLDNEAISKKIIETANLAINKSTLRNNHQKIKVTVDDNEFNYTLSSTILNLNTEYKYYSYNDNLRMFKAISDYIKH